VKIGRLTFPPRSECCALQSAIRATEIERFQRKIFKSARHLSASQPTNAVEFADKRRKRSWRARACREKSVLQFIGKNMIRFSVNGERIETDVAADTPLLWFLRDNLQMTGTKYGCGIALCGACTVHINGEPSRSCSTLLSAVAGKRVTTIEDISTTPIGKKVQAAWLSEDVVQCGYCQSGQIMSAIALLTKVKNPTDVQIDDAMAGNICRCGTYNRVRAAIKVAASGTAAKPVAPAKTPTAKAKA